MFIRFNFVIPNWFSFFSLFLFNMKQIECDLFKPVKKLWGATFSKIPSWFFPSLKVLSHAMAYLYPDTTIYRVYFIPAEIDSVCFGLLSAFSINTTGNLWLCHWHRDIETGIGGFSSLNFKCCYPITKRL